MELSVQLRSQIWRTQDWFARLVELEWEAKRIADPWQRSEAYLELARAADAVVPDRQRALALYHKAWQASGECLAALARARGLYVELNLLSKAAEVAEVEFRSSNDPTLLAISGELWLDAGELERAAARLTQAHKLLEGDEDVAESLAVARGGSSAAEAVKLERAAAAESDPATSSRKFLHAALIQRGRDGPGPAVESLLRRAIDADPRNRRAFALLAGMLEAQRQWVDFIELHEMCADTAPSDREQIDVYRLGGMALAVRHKQLRPGSRLLATALSLAYDRKIEDIPCHLAMLTLLRSAYGGNQVGQLVNLYDRALAGPLSEDERLFIATSAGRLAWKQLDDIPRADQYLSVVKQIVPDHPLVDKFERGSGTLVTERSDLEAGEQRARDMLREQEEQMTGAETRRYLDPGPPPGQEARAPRQHVRVPANNVVSVSATIPVDVDSSNVKFRAYTRDLSESGVFVKTERDVAAGVEFALRVRFPGSSEWDEEVYELTARVVRSEPGVGFAATLQGPPEGYIAKIRALVSG